MTRSERARFPQRLEHYFGGADEGRAFAADVHEALIRLLRRFGGEPFWIAASAIQEARRRLIERNAELLDAAARSDLASDERLEAVSRATAVLAVAIAEARPIKGLQASGDPDEQPRNLLLAPNAYCALVIGLSIAILTLSGETADPYVVVGSADMAVDAAFAKLSTALRARDPAAALAKEFSALLPLLP